MFDYYYLVLVVPTLIISMIAQARVKSVFAKYSKMQTRRGIRGREAAGLLGGENAIANVPI